MCCNTLILQSYSEVVSCFEDDVSKRSLLICEAVNFQAVNSSVDALKKSIPLLSSSLKTLLKYPEIEEAQVGYILLICWFNNDSKTTHRR